MGWSQDNTCKLQKDSEIPHFILPLYKKEGTAKNNI